MVKKTNCNMTMNKSNIDKNDIISEWVNKYSDNLYSWALYKVSDSVLAEDLVQETFISAFTGYDNFKQNSNPKTWLLAILNNKIIDTYRKAVNKNTIMSSHLAGNDDSNFFENFFDSNESWNKSQTFTDWGNSDNLLDNQEFRLILQMCVKELPKNWSVVLLYKYIDNKTGKEICHDLDITSSNYWQILHRAKLQLRNCIEQNWFKKE